MIIKDISKESKVVLAVFIKQLLDIINSDKIDQYKITEIREHTALWVDANNLHPENVVSITELQEMFKKSKNENMKN